MLLEGSTYRNGDGVQPWKYVCWEDLIKRHTREGIPEIFQWLWVLDLLPVKPLESFHNRQFPPIDSLNVPDSKGPHESTEATAKETDRDNAQDDSGGAQRKIVEQLLCRKHCRGIRNITGCRGGDHRDRMLLKTERPRIHKLNDCDPPRGSDLPILFSPSRLKLITAGEKFSPGGTDKVGNKNEKNT